MSDEPAAVRTIPDPEDVPPGEPLHVVRVLNAPLQLWAESSEHTEELMREFTLLTLGAQEGLTRDIPRQLLDLVASLRARYAGVSAQQAAELQAALDAGAQRRDFRYEVPVSVADGCRTLLELLDAADEYCASGALMTLVSPPEQRAFRRWYLGEFIGQLQGEPARPWPG